MKSSNYLIFSLLVLSFSLSAQITITNEIFPSEGDSLLYAFDNQSESIEVGLAGENQLWDLSNLQQTNTWNQVFLNAAEGEGSSRFPTANLYFEALDSIETYVKTSDERVELVGVFGADPLNFGFNLVAPFEPAITQKIAPLSYLDKSQYSYNYAYDIASSDLPDTIINSLTVVPDSIRIRFNNEREDIVDAWGTVTIPGGTYEVLRQKRVENLTVRLEAKVPIFGWQDVTDLVLPLIENSVPFQLPTQGESTSYHYFSNDAKETIAIIYLTNDTIRSVQYKNNEITTALNKLNISAAAVKIFPNPTADFITIEINEATNKVLYFSLFDATGRILKQKTLNINSSQSNHLIKFNGLISGIYTYSIFGKEQGVIESGQLVISK